MTFGAPEMLWSLLLLPLALLGYLARRRSVTRYAVRFTGVPGLKLAAAAVPRWRRHLPAALALAALAALGLALAKPQRTSAVAVDRATIVVVTDHSRSMLATDVGPDRLTAAKDAAHAFLRQLPPGVEVGVVTFADAPDQVLAPTRSRNEVGAVIDQQEANGATATGDALQAALDLVTRSGRRGHRPPAAIVLLSDGATTTGVDPVGVAKVARGEHVPIYTVSLGTGAGLVPSPGLGAPIVVQPDPALLRKIADASGGHAFAAQDSGRLSAIYRSLGSRLGQRKVRHETTAAFAVGALVLLLAAAASSVRWVGRLP